jgi:serine/threonine protein kinase
MEALWLRWNRPANSFTLHTRKRTYEVEDLAWCGSVANLYRATDGDGKDVIVKIGRNPRNNDLMEREARALRCLHPKEEDSPHLDKFRFFSPLLLDAFKSRDSDSGKERRVNVLSPTEEAGWYTLEQVHQVYSELEPRSAAWMWRRLLHFASRCEEVGVVHGAVTPDNVIIHPEKHGLMLVGWTYSSIEGTTIPAFVKSYKDLYPPEVGEKKAPDTSTDIYMISKLMEYMMGEPPRLMRAFIRGCAIPSMALRPQNPGKLHIELDTLLERMFGRRTFYPFSMPSTVMV